MSIERTVRRNQMKSGYKQFCSAWSEQRQKERDEGKAPAPFSRKPTFAEWLKMSEAFLAKRRLETRQNAAAQRLADTIDTSWDEPQGPVSKSHPSTVFSIGEELETKPLTEQFVEEMARLK